MRLLAAASLALAATATPAATFDAAATFPAGRDSDPFYYLGNLGGLSDADCGALVCRRDGNGSGVYLSPGQDRDGFFFTYPADRLVAQSTTDNPLAVLFLGYGSGTRNVTVAVDYLLSLSGADLDVALYDNIANQRVGYARLNAASTSAAFSYAFTATDYTDLVLVLGYGPSIGVTDGPPPGVSGDFAAAFDFAIDGAFTGPPAVPEPGAWALMIVGFGAVGSALRRRAPATAASV